MSMHFCSTVLMAASRGLEGVADLAPLVLAAGEAGERERGGGEGAVRVAGRVLGRAGLRPSAQDGERIDGGERRERALGLDAVERVVGEGAHVRGRLRVAVAE